jgi:hypothetical protein
VQKAQLIRTPHFIYQLHPYSLLLSSPFSLNGVYSRLLFFCLKNNDMLQQKQNWVSHTKFSPFSSKLDCTSAHLSVTKWVTYVLQWVSIVIQASRVTVLKLCSSRQPIRKCDPNVNYLCCSGHPLCVKVVQEPLVHFQKFWCKIATWALCTFKCSFAM